MEGKDLRAQVHSWPAGLEVTPDAQSTDTKAEGVGISETRVGLRLGGSLDPVIWKQDLRVVWS